ncbi:FAD-binding oxidoreductase [Modestobacter versicolor]|uniref:FAD-binding oxidoreductase n=1 Tax=Modestobacter versicolor TaxID=429133 RepID=UPI0034DF5B3E
MTALQHRTATTPAALAAELAAATTGDVLAPGDDGWTEALAGFNLATQHRPELVLVAADAADVATAVRLAARTGRRVAVQATGHGAAAAGPGTVLVSTRRLTGLSVDPRARTATLGAGVRWQQVLDAAAPHGLAALAGSAPGVGAVGYTVGGGLGPVARTFGFAADHVRSLEVVTADGELRRVDAEHEPDLFWALRGGGAAFGLVTAMTVDLFPVATLYAGGLFFSAEVARTVLHRWRDWTQDLPETVSTSVARIDLPPLPELPEPLRGREVVHVRFAFVGDAAEGERWIAPLRTAATPLLDTVGELPYAALGAVHADPVDPLPAMERGSLLAELPPAAVEAFVAVTSPAADLPVMVAELRLLGGAVARPAAVPNAVGGRSAAYALEAVGVLAPPIAALVPQALETVLSAMAPWSTGGALVNFAGGTDRVAVDRVRQAFGDETWDRMVALREATDPDGVLSPAARWSVDAEPVVVLATPDEPVR